MENQTTITSSLIKKINRICINMQFKTGVASEDLLSEALSKLPLIQKNFSSKPGIPFETYALLSIRGYCLNYCRDKSFLSGIGRPKLRLYQLSKKFPNLRVAAASLMVDYDELVLIHTTISNLRNYNQADLSKEWDLPKQVETKNISVYLSRILTDDEIDLLEKYTQRKILKNKQIQGLLDKVNAHKESLLDILHE